MSDTFKDIPFILKYGIFDLLMGGSLNDIDRKPSDKSLSGMEAAVVLAEEELEILLEEYKCLRETPAQIAEKINEEVIGQEDVVSKLVYVAYYNQVANLAEELGLKTHLKRINLLMIGPTGCGKTSSINSLKKHFKVPIAKYSADSITSEGYIGNKITDILLRLFEEAGQNLSLAERGIIFIDEIDKKVSQETSAGKDINGTAVQEELLKILEPNVIDVTLPNKARIPFDTSKLTVILGGSFVGLDKIRRKRICKKSIGFKSDDKEITDEDLMEAGYIPQDIINFGFIPEFVGRAKFIVELRKLNVDDMIKIMFKGKNSPYIEATRFLADVLNVEQQISKEYLRRVAEDLANSDTGARDLESKIINMFFPINQIAFEHRGEYGICFIDEFGMYSLEYDNVVYYGQLEI